MKCMNPECDVDVNEDEFVYQRSTRHERWWCSIMCAVRSLELHHEEIYKCETEEDLRAYIARNAGRRR